MKTITDDFAITFSVLFISAFSSFISSLEKDGFYLFLTGIYL